MKAAITYEPKKPVVDPEHAEASVLVVGAGVAGLQAAVCAAREGARVTLVSDGPTGKSGNSLFIELLAETTGLVGGVDRAEIDGHWEDLVAMGGGLNDPALARTYVEGVATELAELLQLGLVNPVDRSAPQGTAPGLPRVNVKVPRGFSDHLLERLKAEAEERGVQILDGLSLKRIFPSGTGGVALFAAKHDGEMLISYQALILAAGGLGGLFSLSTNPHNVRGSALAAFLLAGGRVVNPEIIQYLPVVQKYCRGFFQLSRVLVRGSLVCADCGETLYTPETWNADRRLLVLRDMCLTMDRHGCSGTFNWRLLHPEGVAESIPYTWGLFARAGAPLDATVIPMGVGAHHLCGGIQVDSHARSSIPGIYATGEIAGGIQGADRLAGSGFLEGLVLGRLAGADAARWAAENGGDGRLEIPYEPLTEDRLNPQLKAWRQELGRAMDSILALKDEASLRKAWDAVRAIRAQAEAPTGGSWSTALDAVSAEMVIAASLWRKETRGSFSRRDYTEADPTFARPTLVEWNKTVNGPVVLEQEGAHT